MGYTVSVIRDDRHIEFSSNISHGAMRRALTFLAGHHADAEDTYAPAFVAALDPGYNDTAVTRGDCLASVSDLQLALAYAQDVDLPEAWVIEVLYRAAAYAVAFIDSEGVHFE